MEELIEQLSHCQVINKENPLYKEIEKLEEDKDWYALVKRLNKNGYNITYHNVEDSYVIY